MLWCVFLNENKIYLLFNVVTFPVVKKEIFGIMHTATHTAWTHALASSLIMNTMPVALPHKFARAGFSRATGRETESVCIMMLRERIKLFQLFTGITQADHVAT